MGEVGVIPLKQLQEMFENIRRNTKWNVDGRLLWGYFFTDSAPERLQTAGDFLVGEGYRLVGINETEPGLFVLHVELVETHSAETLFARNSEFYAISDRFDLESYDGMDVGPVAAVN